MQVRLCSQSFTGRCKTANTENKYSEQFPDKCGEQTAEHHIYTEITIHIYHS